MTADSPGSASAAREAISLTLLADARTPDTRVLASVSGARGSGKSALLDELERRSASVGLAVGRDDPAQLSAEEESSLLLVDDAHRLDDAVIDGIGDYVENGKGQLVVAFRPWPHSLALSRLLSSLERHRPPLVLGALTRDEVAEHLSATVGPCPRPWSRASSTRQPECRGSCPASRARSRRRRARASRRCCSRLRRRSS